MSQAKSWLRIAILFILLMSVRSVYAQDDGVGIDAPAEYTLDIINLPNTHPTAFTIDFEFTGTNQETAEDASLALASTVHIQPEPIAFRASFTADGYLLLFDLVPITSADQTVIAAELAYVQKGYYVFVTLPDTDESSCGKQTLAPSAAGTKLDTQLPFPTDIFYDNLVPALPRVYPDGEFAGQPTARYAITLDERAIAGQFEVEILPKTMELIVFKFSGSGNFQAQDGAVRLNGDLIYHYQRHIPPVGSMSRPAGCENPQVQGVPIYEPSVQWVTRTDIGEFTTNQSIESLIEFYAERLSPLGFEFVDQTPIEFGQTILTYIAPSGDEVRIGFLDQWDGGVEVNIQFLPAFIDS